MTASADTPTTKIICLLLIDLLLSRQLRYPLPPCWSLRRCSDLPVPNGFDNYQRECWESRQAKFEPLFRFPAGQTVVGAAGKKETGFKRHAVEETA
jgi:hypothetical protein